jgi:uncharacterized protein
MVEEKEKTLIIAFVSDLMFTTKIHNVAIHNNFRIKWIETADELGNPAAMDVKETPGERLHGSDGELFNIITALQPGLLLFDLTNGSIPWQRWIPALKASPATRRIPIMSYGPHEDVALMKQAKACGADWVLARSRFTSEMGSLFKKHARPNNLDSLHEFCHAPLPPLVQEGLALFNKGAYYKCHDALEAAWQQEQDAGRELYRAILQVGIAYFQIERGNYRGAVKMLLRVRQWLAPFPDKCQQIDVTSLKTQANVVYDALTQLGEKNIDSFDRSLFQPIYFKDS